MIVADGQSSCTDTFQSSVLVYANPIADFSINGICLNDITQFTSTSLNTNNSIINNWQWDFDDPDPTNNISIDPNSTHTYTIPGIYDVSLIVTDNNGCDDTLFNPVTIYPLPEPSYTLNQSCMPDPICIGSSVLFSDNSFLSSVGGVISSWEWDFDIDGSIDNVNSSFFNSFNNIGEIPFSLNVISQFGCSDLLIDTLLVVDSPITEFLLDTNSGCGPFLITIDSNLTTGYTSDYFWDVYTVDPLGNNFSVFSTSDSLPTQIPPLQQSNINDTTYYISLTASNCCGSTDYIEEITVLPTPVPLVQTAPNTGCSPLPVIFQLDGLATGESDSLILDFGDGSITTVQQDTTFDINGNPVYFWPQINHTYTYTGSLPSVSYFPVLTGVNDCGSVSITDTIEVFPNTIQSFFTTSSSNGCAPLVTIFNDFSSGATNVSWCYNWDSTTGVCLDGNTLGSFTYTVPGTYTTAQFINNGCSYDTSFLDINVLPAPVAQISTNGNICFGDSSYFNALNSSMVSGSIIEYEWTINASILAYGNVVEFLFENTGSYDIVLTTTADNGCQDVVTSSLEVLNLPNSDFIIDSVCFNEQPFQIINNSLGNIINYNWYWGDGTSTLFPSQPSPEHIYNSDGIYNIDLIVQEANGCWDTTMQTVQIFSIPNSSFNAFDYDSCSVPSLVTFDNLSIGASQYNWVLDSNNPLSNSQLFTPSYTYDDYGNYIVELIAANSFGCVDTSYQEINFTPSPEANFIINNPSGCAPLFVSISDSSSFDASSSNIINWEWSFSDGTTDNGSFVTHEFYNPGTYDISLVVTTDEGCSDNLILQDIISVSEIPNADFSINTDNEPLISFTNNTFLGLPPYSFIWDFGDNTPLLNTNDYTVTHDYILDGLGSDSLDYIFDICLYVVDQNNCVDSICKTIAVEPFSMSFPNALAPSSQLTTSGEQKYFLPKGRNVKNYHIWIYDKFGMKVWESTSLNSQGTPNEPWYGTTIDGKELPPGAYLFKAYVEFYDESKSFGTNNVKYGYITLIR